MDFGEQFDFQTRRKLVKERDNNIVLFMLLYFYGLVIHLFTLNILINNLYNPLPVM